MSKLKKKNIIVFLAVAVAILLIVAISITQANSSEERKNYTIQQLEADCVPNIMTFFPKSIDDISFSEVLLESFAYDNKEKVYNARAIIKLNSEKLDTYCPNKRNDINAKTLATAFTGISKDDVYYVFSYNDKTNINVSIKKIVVSTGENVFEFKPCRYTVAGEGEIEISVNNKTVFRGEPETASSQKEMTDEEEAAMLADILNQAKAQTSHTCAICKKQASYEDPYDPGTWYCYDDYVKALKWYAGD